MHASLAWQNAGEELLMNEMPTPARSASPLLQRVLYMIVFAVVFWILCWVIGLTAIAQLALRLLNGKPHQELARFGSSVGRYARQVIEYLAFATDEAPFPFRDWQN
jgi:cytochrome b